MTGAEPVAVAVITERAAARSKQLGAGVEDALEELRRELEYSPRLGVRRGIRAGWNETYKTRIEARNGVPGLAVSYLYVPYPPPPAVAIVSLVPDGSPVDPA